MDVNRFKELPLMGIVRGIDASETGPLMEAVIEAGLETIEVTMNTPGAAGIISKACEVSGGRVAVGAGTVLSTEDVKEACEAGASFIVMPVLEENAVTCCAGKGIPVFPGAFSPREVLDAWNAGATMVKVFPCGMFGPKYIKELKGPFKNIELMAVGGVRVENIGEYFSSGADAVAFGASVFREEWLAEKDFASIGNLVGEYVSAVRAAVSGS
ncbi:MAG: bifunctional 4-hydroxy-2-oxoglutarate aldolase/2-dehydro-3-deoxy-phosphogluconate aldolase [Candidatus Omnitrophota bacterium]|nr:bifunctional 4-hydroxy-2-oxoglutarate aldolase/2-dehydro-3-deoxy-phosphogluconate aldolase [Candidatus Omnitrophota bacterium]